MIVLLLAKAVPLEQAAEVGAIETGQARALRDRSDRALHHADEVATLERTRRETLGFGERHRRRVVNVHELRSLDGHQHAVPLIGVGGENQLLHDPRQSSPRADVGSAVRVRTETLGIRRPVFTKAPH
jgi:hypothetical protein